MASLPYNSLDAFRGAVPSELGFHGGRLDADDASELFLAHDLQLAHAYAEGDGHSSIHVVRFEAERPLVLDSPQAFVRAWAASRAHQSPPPFHPRQTHRFADWARDRGHDVIHVPAPAFEGELGYLEVGGRVGEPQSILLEPTRAHVLGVTSASTLEDLYRDLGGPGRGRSR